jgi:hypothetical protein
MIKTYSVVNNEGICINNILLDIENAIYNQGTGNTLVDNSDGTIQIGDSVQI